MEISGPITPGQVSFILGLIPLLAAWAYSELLEHRKNSAAVKGGRNSDINLVDLNNTPNGEDDQAQLLEGGLRATSPKAHNSPVSGHLIRFFSLEDTFLLENRLTLRAISEFGGHLLFFYICDRTNLFGQSEKSYSRDLFLFLYFLLIIVAAITSFKVHHEKSPFSGKSILYLNRHQTEEWKGWMQAIKSTCILEDPII